MTEETKMVAECKPCKIKTFLERQHTPAEKGLIIVAGVLTGVLIGLAIAPATGGIEISVGSHNGSENNKK